MWKERENRSIINLTSQRCWRKLKMKVKIEIEIEIEDEINGQQIAEFVGRKVSDFVCEIENIDFVSANIVVQ